MKDSSRWLLIIAMFALIVAISSQSSGWLFSGMGSTPTSVILLIAFAIWMTRGKGCCWWNSVTDEEEYLESDEDHLESDEDRVG